MIVSPSGGPNLGLLRHPRTSKPATGKQLTQSYFSQPARIQPLSPVNACIRHGVRRARRVASLREHGPNPRRHRSQPIDPRYLPNRIPPGNLRDAVKVPRDLLKNSRCANYMHAFTHRRPPVCQAFASWLRRRENASRTGAARIANVTLHYPKEVKRNAGEPPTNQQRSGVGAGPERTNGSASARTQASTRRPSWSSADRAAKRSGDPLRRRGTSRSIARPNARCGSR